MSGGWEITSQKEKNSRKNTLFFLNYVATCVWVEFLILNHKKAHRKKIIPSNCNEWLLVENLMSGSIFLHFCAVFSKTTTWTGQVKISRQGHRVVINENTGGFVWRRPYCATWARQKYLEVLLIAGSYIFMSCFPFVVVVLLSWTSWWYISFFCLKHHGRQLSLMHAQEDSQEDDVSFPVAKATRIGIPQRQGHPTSIFGKYLLGGWYEI